MRRVRLPRFLLLGLWFAVPLLFILAPPAVMETWHPVCLIRNLFGLNCPGCGMTRAFSSIFHADLAGAYYYNKSVVVVFPLVFFIYIQKIAAIFREGRRTKFLKN